MAEKNILKLSVTTAILFVFSLLVYWNEHKTSTHLVQGSEFLMGLNVEKVRKITLKDKGGRELVLNKVQNSFVLENHQSYPAANFKVNDLLYNILSINIDEMISESQDAEYLKKLGLSPGGANLQVTMYDEKENKIVDFLVGETLNGKGNYLHKSESKVIYLSSGLISLSTNKNDYIDRSIYQIKAEDITAVNLKDENKGLQIQKQDKYLVEGLPEEELDEGKIKDYLRALQHVEFLEYFAAGDSAIGGLAMPYEFTIALSNHLIYQFKLGQKGDKNYLQVQLNLHDVPQEVQISKTDGMDKLTQVDGLFKARDQVNLFNQMHARWVYEVDGTTYKRFFAQSSEFARAKKAPEMVSHTP